MANEKEYFDIQIEQLQSVGKWAADAAERALPIFERIVPGDDRPRNAINEIRRFSESGKRTHALRKLALDAWRASSETPDAAASAAARSASLAASSAYTHPFRDVKQSKHILGPAAYAALAMELSSGAGQTTGDQEIQRAIESATVEIVSLLNEMPEQVKGSKRIDQLTYELDRGVRNKRRFT